MPLKNRPRSRSARRRVLIVCALAVCLCLFMTSCVTTSSGTKINLFTLIFCWPFAYALRWLYDMIGSYGWSIILLQVIVKIVLLPLNIKSKKATMGMQKIQPQVKALEAKYKDDKNKYTEEVSKLYQKEGVSPTAGCLPTLITFPILIGLYWPISQPLTYLMRLSADEIAKVKDILGLVQAKSEITVAQGVFENFDKVSSISEKLIRMDFNFLGMNLGATPSYRVFNLLFLLPIISALTALGMSLLSQWTQKKQTGVAMEGNNKTMLYMMPIMSLWIGFTLPAGLCVYWIAGSVTGILQELFMYWYFQKRPAGKGMSAKEAAVAEKSAEMAAKLTSRTDAKVAAAKKKKKKK